MPSATTDFNVLMLGPRGAGKTTLLAVMWSQLGSSLNDASGAFRYDHATALYFGQAEGELRRMYHSPGLTVNAGISGTDDPRALTIELTTANHINPHLRMNFWDYPGGLLNPESANGSNAAVFDSRIANANYFFVVVDAPSLMEHGGKFHFIRNRPSAIKTLLHNRITASICGAQILFVVTKCEKYVREGRDQELFRAVQIGYQDLLSDIKFSPSSSADICLVETLGSVILDKIESVMTPDGQEYPRYYWKKISENAVHSPRNTELPLKLIIDRAIFASLAERRKYYEGLNWLRDIVGRDDELTNLLTHLRNVSSERSDASAHLSLAKF